MTREEAHKGDPCIYCGVPYDDVPVGPCRAKATLDRIVERLEAEADWSYPMEGIDLGLSRAIRIVKEEGEG